MSNISGLLGTAGGFKGTGVSGPQNPVTPGQLNTAYGGTQTAMQGQQDLLTALQAQNGLQNQTNVFNQMQGVANGTGPNPAQTMLAQATGANTANQAALMAGQRGASQNVGLIARQAAQQGAANQQQSAGQAATMQSQQQLNALQQLGGQAAGMAANQIGQTNANTQSQQAEQQSLLSANQGMNMVNAGLIGATAQQQASFGGGAMNGVGSMMSSMGAEGGKVTSKGFDNGGQVKGNNGAGIMSLLALMADGGQVKMYANGTQDQPVTTDSTPKDQSAYTGKSKFGAFLKSAGQQQGQNSSSGNKSQDPIVQGMGNFGAGLGHLISSPSTPDYTYQGERGSDDMTTQYLGANTELGSGGDTEQVLPADNSFAKGGKVPALVSPGEQYLKPQDVQKVKAGANPMKVGEKIPGKPKVSGAKNDYANDTVPKDLDEGGIVIPRSVTQGPNAHWNAMKFVHQTLRKGKK